jgi:hypothetical protein
LLQGGLGQILGYRLLGGFRQVHDGPLGRGNHGRPAE